MSIHSKSIGIGFLSDRVSGTLHANAMLDMQMVTLNAPDEQTSIMLSSIPTIRPSIAIMRGNSGMSPMTMRAVTNILSPSGMIEVDRMPLLELRSSVTNLPAWRIRFDKTGRLVIEPGIP